VSADAGPVFPSIYLAQEAAIHGHGVALGLAPLVEEDLRRGRLVRPSTGQLANAYAFWTVRPLAARRKSATDVFSHWLHREAVGTFSSQLLQETNATGLHSSNPSETKCKSMAEPKP